MKKSIKQIIENREFLLDLFDVVDADKTHRRTQNSPKDFSKLSDNEQEELIKYCLTSFVPASTTNWSTTSYGMKHTFEDLPYGFYLSNGQFKGAMLIAGSLPVNPHELNWCYMVDKGCYGACSFGRNRTLNKQTDALLQERDILRDFKSSQKKEEFNISFSKPNIKYFTVALNKDMHYFR